MKIGSPPLYGHHDESVTFGDASSTSVEAIGKVKVNNKFVIKDVALIKNLKYNLLCLTNDRLGP
jgi:hypothetical protein